jgi:hypothetical protein
MTDRLPDLEIVLYFQLNIGMTSNLLPKSDPWLGLH